MKFFDLSPQKNLKKKILKNFNKILKDGSYILGENVYALERT